MKAAYFETTGTPDVIRIGDLPTPFSESGRDPRQSDGCIDQPD